MKSSCPVALAHRRASPYRLPAIGAPVRIRRSALVLAALLVTLTGCSSDADADSDSVIIAAADSELLPYNMLSDDGLEWTGINIDLGAALSEKLGRKIVFENADFDEIVTGVSVGTYDIGLTGMFDTVDRQKQVDFVDYLLADNNFLTMNTFRDISDFDDLCGEKVGITTGALEASLLTAASQKCLKNGDQLIDVSSYDTIQKTTDALLAGDIDVTPNDSAANAYFEQQHPKKLKTSGSYLSDGYFAAAFPKNSDLTAEFKDAFAQIMSDGTYAEILEKWGIPGRAMDAPSINAATS